MGTARITGSVQGDPNACGWHVSDASTGSTVYFFEASDQVQEGQSYTITYNELSDAKTCPDSSTQCTGGSVVSAAHG